MNPEQPISAAPPAESEPQVRRKELLAALREQYVTAEDERRETRKRLENSSAEYQCALRRSQEAWNKLDAAQKESAANND